jgi:hypothetical protein
VTAIMHTTGIVTVTAILGLIVRGVAPQLRAVLRELSILRVIALTGRKKLSAQTSLAMIRELTDAGNVPAAGNIQRAAGARSADRSETGDAVSGPALRRQMPGNRPELPGATFDAKSA